jgi:hypothetical protein
MTTVVPPLTGPELGSTALTVGAGTPMLLDASGWNW